MKSKFLVLLACVVIISVETSQGTSFSLESVDGLYATDSVLVGTPIVFNLRITNNASYAFSGVANGFQVYSPDGAQWISTVGDTFAVDFGGGDGWEDIFDLAFTINSYSITGDGADTVAYQGATLFGSGLPAGFSDVSYKITTGPIDAAYHGSTICLDSCYFPPSGTWKWAAKNPNPSVIPAWDGPHCFTIFDPNAPVPANLVLTPSTLNFTAEQFGSNPTSQSFTVSEAGGQAISYTSSETAGWMTLTNPNGSTPGDVTVDIQIAGLAPGSYSETVTVSSAEADNSPQNVTVNLEITAPPKILELSPTSLNFTAVENGADPASQLFTVSEQNGAAISFTASETAPWMTLTNSSGTTPGDVTVDVSVAGLAPGTYNESIMVSSGEATNSPQYVNVTFEVTPAPKFLEVAPTSLNFIATEGGPDPASQIFTVSEQNGAVISYTASETAGWMTLTNPAGNTPGDVTVNIQISGLTVGTYNHSVVVTSGEADNSPQSVPVTLEIVSQTILVATPDTLKYDAVLGGADPGTLSSTISELGGGAIPITATETASWFDLGGFTSGTTPSSIDVAVQIAGLGVGDHKDSVEIASIEADNSPIYLYVLLNIAPPPNQPPVITSPVVDVTIDECDTLDINFTATDADGDPLNMWMDGLVENMTFNHDGAGNGQFNFIPNFSQAGSYPLTLNVADNEDTVSASFTITVDECLPGTEGDTVTVATVPAVPGAQVLVQVDFANLCDVNDLYAALGWTSDDITLDSANFSDSRLSAITDKLVEIDNTNDFVKITTGFSDPNPIIPGSGNLVNLYFSLAVATPAGFYPLDLYIDPVWFGLNPQYTRDCGTGEEAILPYFITGGIVVDTSGNYVCGYVVDTNGVPIPGAMVELWDDFPTGSIMDNILSSGTGVFSFADFNTIPFDLWAYKDGYYPGKVENINFAQSGIMIVLTPYDSVYLSNTNVDFYCASNTYLGAPLPVGSVIDAYDPDGIRCGTITVTTAGEYNLLHVYGDDEFEPGDQGAMPGDVIRFFINGVEAITSSLPIWTQDGDIHEICLDVPNTITKTCPLTAGWNLVSWNVDTESDYILDVLTSLDGCLEVVRGFEQGALTFDIDLQPFSDLWEVDHLSGYWIKVSCDIDLEVIGTPVPVTTPIPVTTGWNLVSFLPEVAIPTADALATIHDNLIVALGYDNGKLTYVPGEDPFNDLIELGPCFGYWVKITADGSLIYPGDGPKIAPQSDKNIFSSIASSTTEVTPTNSWVNMYSQRLTLDKEMVSSGTEISAYTMDGIKVGNSAVRENGLFGFMPVYGDDPTTSEIEGLTDGQSFYLTINGIKTNETFTWNRSDNKIEFNSLTSKSSSEITLPEAFSLNQNYPNPFNPSTVISFTLPTAGITKIEIFNLLGKLVATPFDGLAGAGLNEAVWDGRNLDGKMASSGIYLYRLTADNFTETKKMILLK